MKHYAMGGVGVGEDVITTELILKKQPTVNTCWVFNLNPLPLCEKEKQSKSLIFCKGERERQHASFSFPPCCSRKVSQLYPKIERERALHRIQCIPPHPQTLSTAQDRLFIMWMRGNFSLGRIGASKKRNLNCIIYTGFFLA